MVQKGDRPFPNAGGTCQMGFDSGMGSAISIHERIGVVPNVRKIKFPHWVGKQRSFQAQVGVVAISRKGGT
jgi:hypothetical protein